MSQLAGNRHGFDRLYNYGSSLNSRTGISDKT
jgi:hypothetical protein